MTAKKIHYGPHTWIEEVNPPGGPACGRWQAGVFKAAHDPTLVTCRRCKGTDTFREGMRQRED